MKRIAALVPLVAANAFGQCVMCFRTAEAQSAARARVLNLGIIIMLIPPVLILAGFLVLCYKRRKTYATGEEALHAFAPPVEDSRPALIPNPLSPR